MKQIVDPPCHVPSSNRKSHSQGIGVDKKEVHTGFFYPRPVLASGYCRCLCLCVCVCLSVCPCVHQPRACPRHNSSRVQARTIKFGQRMQNNLVKVPLVFFVFFLGWGGGGGGWGRLIMAFKFQFHLKQRSRSWPKLGFINQLTSYILPWRSRPIAPQHNRDHKQAGLHFLSKLVDSGLNWWWVMAWTSSKWGKFRFSKVRYCLWIVAELITSGLCASGTHVWYANTINQSSADESSTEWQSMGLTSGIRAHARHTTLFDTTTRDFKTPEFRRNCRAKYGVVARRLIHSNAK